MPIFKLSIPILLRNPLIGIAALLLGTSSLFAQSFTFDWPAASPVFPEWMEAPSETSHSLLSALYIPISPSDQPDASLAVTLFFIEPDDGFLRVFWTSPTSEILLARNLVTGVGMPHKHTLLIPYDQLQSAGVLTIESSEPQQLVYRVRLEWVAPYTITAGEEAPIPDLMGSDGNTADLDELLGEPYLPPSDEWTNDVISAPLIDRIERIETGVDFAMELNNTPQQARLAVWLTGPEVTAAVTVFVNNTYAGILSIHVPPLFDEGYYQDQNGAWRYAGWRKGVVALPETLLVPGENLLHFEWENMEGETPFAIKDMILQLRYSMEAPAEEIPPQEEGLPHGSLGPMLKFMVADPLLSDSQM